MGFTHYWERPRVLPRPQFLSAVEDCRRLCDTLQIPLGDARGRGQPTFSAEEICFNGHVDSGKLTSLQSAEGLAWPNPVVHGVPVVGEPDSVVGKWHGGIASRVRMLGQNGDGSYETFRVEQIAQPRYPRDQSDWSGNFCKTNYQPYDLCVQGCLIVLSHNLRIGHFRVSSDGKSEQWNDARNACQHVLGYGTNWGEGKLAPVAPSQQG